MTTVAGLIQRVDALGHSVEFGYDAYGRLQHLSNENHQRYRFEWDTLDRLLAQQDLDGSGRIYQYNPLGEVTGICHVPAPLAELDLDGKVSAEPHTPLEHHFERDAVGRLVRKRTDDGITEYAYDKADNLLAVNFTNVHRNHQRLDYSHGALGQLLSETNSARELTLLLADHWREKLGLTREQTRAALAHPRISVTELHSGQWIELGEQPDLYPVENGVPERPMRLNKLLKPIRYDDLGLLGFGQWDGDPNERFTDADSRRWMARSIPTVIGQRRHRA